MAPSSHHSPPLPLSRTDRRRDTPTPQPACLSASDTVQDRPRFRHTFAAVDRGQGSLGSFPTPAKVSSHLLQQRVLGFNSQCPHPPTGTPQAISPLRSCLSPCALARGVSCPAMPVPMLDGAGGSDAEQGGEDTFNGAGPGGGGVGRCWEDAPCTTSLTCTIQPSFNNSSWVLARGHSESTARQGHRLQLR